MNKEKKVFIDNLWMESDLGKWCLLIICEMCVLAASLAKWGNIKQVIAGCVILSFPSRIPNKAYPSIPDSYPISVKGK